VTPYLMGNNKNSWFVPHVLDVPDDVWTAGLFIDRKGYSWLCILWKGAQPMNTVTCTTPDGKVRYYLVDEQGVPGRR